MGELFDVVVQFFTEDDWPFEIVEGRTMLRTAFQGENGRFRCFAQTREEQYQFVFYSGLYNNTPEDKRAAMAEFLTRANYGMVIGNFELDFSDGEVRYKTSIDVEGDRLTTALVKQMVYASVARMDSYVPGIMAVMYGAKTPLEAIVEIEGPAAAPPTEESSDTLTEV